MTNTKLHAHWEGLYSLHCIATGLKCISDIDDCVYSVLSSLLKVFLVKCKTFLYKMFSDDDYSLSVNTKDVQTVTQSVGSCILQYCFVM